MKTKIILLAFTSVLFSSIVNATGWSGWSTIQRIDLHPDWGVRVVFDEVVDSTCGSTMAEWTAVDDNVFMNRVTSSLLSAKYAKAKVNLWVSNCENGIAQVNQIQIE